MLSETEELAPQYTAFEGTRCIASGDLLQVALKVKEASDRGDQTPILIFEDATGKQIDIDLRGTPGDVLHRIGAPAEAPADPPRGPGRPKLGVVAREVTLLPKHWDWLNSQPGGASVALRKLVTEAKRANEAKDLARNAREATYRVISALAGNLANFEEASRALYAGDQARFESLTEPWPTDVREHARRMAAPGLA